MGPLLAFIRLLSDPTIAFLLLSAGSAGLLAELWSPNFVTGILGALALILAFIGLGSLPLNVGGLILILFGLVLFGLELTVTSHGLLAIGGLVAFVLGASALYTQPGDPVAPAVSVSSEVLIAMTALTGVPANASTGTRRRSSRQTNPRRRSPSITGMQRSSLRMKRRSSSVRGTFVAMLSERGAMISSTRTPESARWEII